MGCFLSLRCSCLCDRNRYRFLVFFIPILLILGIRPTLAAPGVEDPITSCFNSLSGLPIHAYVINNGTTIANPDLDRQLFQVDSTDDPVVNTALGGSGGPTDRAYDAMGMFPYNSEDPMDILGTADGFLYAVEQDGTNSNNGIVRIDAEGEVFPLGTPVSPVGLTWPSQRLTVGAVDRATGTFYVTDTVVAGPAHTIFIVDVTNSPPTIMRRIG